MGAWYATREDVTSALQVAETARSNAQIDRVLESASRSVEGLLRRKFYPWTGTRYFPWPQRGSRSWRLWLDADELVSVTTLVAGATTIVAADYFLEPVNSGPPYRSIEIDLSSSAAFAAGATPQRAIAVTGVFGYSDESESVGSLAGNLAASTTATANVTWTTARIGVGDVLKIDSERVIVTERSMVDTTQNLGTPLTASTANTSVAVTDGTAFDVGDVLLLDSERMLVVDIASNTLTVKRAYDGSVLATHSGSDVYALRGVELARAQLGTVLAAHLTSAAITRWVVPGLVRELAVAEAVNTLQQEQSGYARVVGDGETAIEVRGQGLLGIRQDALAVYGRRARARAV